MRLPLSNQRDSRRPPSLVDGSARPQSTSTTGSIDDRPPRLNEPERRVLRVGLVSTSDAVGMAKAIASRVLRGAPPVDWPVIGHTGNEGSKVKPGTETASIRWSSGASGAAHLHRKLSSQTRRGRPDNSSLRSNPWRIDARLPRGGRASPRPVANSAAPDAERERCVLSTLD